MSQFDYGTIDPNSKSGPQLALDLNRFRDALNSGHRGASRPPYARSGMSWVQEVSGERWDLMIFDGATDHLLRSINPQTGKPLPIPQENVQGLVELSQALEKNAAPMTGSTGAAAGKKGLVPAPPAGDAERYLSADGTFRPVNKSTLGISALETAQASQAVRIEALEGRKGFTKSFQSTGQSISAGGYLTIPHGFGSPVALWNCYLLCIEAEHNYWPGALISVPGSGIDNSYNLGVSVVPDENNFNCKFGSQTGAFFVLDWVTGTTKIITSSKWRFVIRAWA